jgi:tetratricopeptide (TPR) repeat protein
MTQANTVESVLGRAVQLLNQGQPEAALDCCRRVLKAQPDNTDALQVSGAVACQRGQWQAAVRDFRRAIKAGAPGGECHHNLSIALLQLGRLDEAEQAAREAAERGPGDPGKWAQLGQAALARERWRTAEEAYRNALERAPDDGRLRLGLARALRGAGEWDGAAAELRQAVVRQPGFVEAYQELVRLLRAQGARQEAVAALEPALEHLPGNPEILNALGALHRELDAFEPAEAHLLAAAEADPEAFAPRHNLAALYERFNRPEAARRWVDEALSLRPRDADANLVAAKLALRDGRPEDAAHRLERLRPDDLRSDQELLRRFDLGKAYDRLGEPARALDHAEAGNRIIAQRDRRLDGAGYLEEVRGLAEHFRPEWTAAWTPLPDDGNDAPLFLVGFPRSGTTLLDRMLAGHPDVVTLEERPFMAEVARAVAELPGGYPEALAELSPERAQALRTLYRERLDAARAEVDSQARWVVDRNPFNTKHIGLIARLFPGARIAFLARHPYDVCLSGYLEPIGGNRAVTHFTTLEGAAAFYREMTELWRRYRESLPIAPHWVHYEDLVERPEEAVRALLAHYGIPWDDGVLDHGQAVAGGGKVRTASYHQVAEPVHTRSRYRWQRYRDRLGPVIAALRPYAEELGYEG